jgi:uncharacterized repeat protein (TIGR03803 family)
MMRNFLLVLFLNGSLLTGLQAQRQLWGTSAFGGENNDGFIFTTDSIGDNLEIIHHFKFDVDGEDISALTLASNHKLYGMAASGGLLSGGNVFSGGTFFEYDLTTGTFTVLQHFGAANTALPGVVVPLGSGNPSLTEVSPGILYGIMHQGRYVFAYNISTGEFTRPFTLPLYNGGASNGTLQNKLNQAFVKAADGNFYVTTATNSSCPIPNPNIGSVIRMNAAGTAIAVQHRGACTVADGYIYRGTLAELNGKFYGATDYGGTNNKGVIFEYNFAANTYTKRHDFNNSTHTYAATALVIGANGKLYGTAHGGGIPEAPIGLPSGGGVLFEFDPVSSAFEVKHSFTLAGQSVYDMGVFPSGLIKGPNNKLYGTTQYGVFEYDPAGNTIRTAGRFNYVGFAPSLVSVCRKPVYQHQQQSTFTLCEDQPFIMDLQTPNAVTAAWTHNGTPDASQTTATLSLAAFTAADAGTWSCTLTNACGTTVTQTLTLAAGEPQQPVIETSGSAEFCEGQSITLSAPENYDTYNWSGGQTTREITVNESGSYSVTVSNECTSPPSEAVEVTVNPLPPAPTLTQQYDHGVVLIASGSSSGIYYWTRNDEPLNIQADRITDAQEGLYQVYSISDGCRSAEAASLHVVITGNEPSVTNGVQVYPNPATDWLYIRLTQANVEGRVELYDTRGRYVAGAALSSVETGIDLRAVPAGLYVLMISQPAKVIVRKIQVRK